MFTQAGKLDREGNKEYYDMKNIQVIDGAMNCCYDIFSVSDDDFLVIFPDGQDIEFSDDLFKRLGDEQANKVLEPIWKNQVNKKEVNGIHGTLFYQLEYKKEYYPNKKEADLDLPIKI